MSGNLTPKQTKAIVALMGSRDLAAAAAETGVNPRTIWQWLKQPAFKEELKRAQAGTIEQAQGRLIAGQAAALDTLEELMAHAESEAVRRQAALDWLNMLVRYRDMGEIEARITALEAGRYDNKSAIN